MMTLIQGGRQQEDKKEEDENNYQTIKCLTILESQAQTQLNDDDNKDEN